MVGSVNLKRPLVFGEVLFDCFPDGSAVLGGAPFNVAWHLHGFGESPLFVSCIGDDQTGAKVRAEMDAWGMDTAGLQVDQEHPTGQVRITFEDGEPSYDIVPDQAYDNILAAVLPDMQTPPSFVYHGSLAMRGASAEALDTLLARHAVPVFLDVNLRSPWWDVERVRAMMTRATWLKLNADELDKLAVASGDPLGQARALIDQYGLERVVLTRGKEGAVAIEADGEPITVKPEAATRVVDTVGAGDAFASVLMLGLLRDWPLAVTLRRAQQFASSVVGLRGATVSDPAFYRHHLENWNRAHAS